MQNIALYFLLIFVFGFWEIMHTKNFLFPSSFLFKAIVSCWSRNKQTNKQTDLFLWTVKPVKQCIFCSNLLFDHTLWFLLSSLYWWYCLSEKIQFACKFLVILFYFVYWFIHRKWREQTECISTSGIKVWRQRLHQRVICYMWFNVLTTGIC